ncbi:MAG: hypothetical protein WBK26_05230 [Burkholderiaceae bacterium]
MRTDDLFDVEFGYWFNLANERVYHRLDMALNLVQLVGGSAAALSAMQGNDTAVVASGFALAVCAAVSLLVSPAVKSEQHRATKAQWKALQGRAHLLPEDELRAASREIQGNGPSGITSLTVPAYNSTLRATNQESGVRPLGWNETALAWLA